MINKATSSRDLTRKANDMAPPPPLIKRICDQMEYALQRPDANGVVRRALHAPPLGLLKGTLTVDSDLPLEIAHGLFARPRSYEAWVRFSRAYFFDARTPDTFGMAVKLLGVPGETCLSETPGEYDFIAVNIPYSWVGNIEDLARYFSTLEKNKKKELNRKGERYSRRSTDLMPLNYVFPSPDPRKFGWSVLRLWRIITWNWLRHSDPAVQTYNTLTPSRLGEGSMKCSFRTIPSSGLRTSGSYRERLRQRLSSEPIQFELLVQRRTILDSEPLDDAKRPWKSPFNKVGTLHIPRQEFDAKERLEMEERISYSPFNVLKANEPLGSLNEVRKWAYRYSGIKRSSLCPFHTPEE